MKRDITDQITSETKQAIARSRDLLERTQALPGMQAENTELTPAELADLFAQRARQAILEPAPDGLEVLAELAKSTKPPK